MQKLYQRHADEFSAAMTALVSRATAGGKQMVRIFSLRGAHLLAMFARTPVAKAFRRWVLDILDRELAGLKAQSRSLTQQELTVLAVLRAMNSNGRERLASFSWHLQKRFPRQQTTLRLVVGGAA